ncbi:MAG: peptidoglycan DD-metalloendopeptidase family protein [Clostridia bacterium]|nr:peptidoglycan DD-metalloendopeptidase family protein [Clostridia bacterium]
MSEQEKKPKNKKLLTYYLILGVCILIIAAITVGVIFAVTGTQSPDITIDAGGTSQPDESNSGSSDEENSGDEGNADEGNAGGDVQDTSTATVFILPVESTAAATNCYGFYYNSTLDRYYLHTGIDFSADAGTEVYAAIDGTVESITTGDILKGSVITLSHTGGITTVYTFIEPAENLAVGDSVSRGDVIGAVAEAAGEEYKEGAHLHFEVYANGSAVDPELYLEIENK